MLIGLNGGRGHGKNTTCDFLRQHFEPFYNFVEESFALRLKLSAARSFDPGMDAEKAVKWADWLKEEGRIQIVDAVDPDNEEVMQDISGRQFLQRYGTEGHREVFGTNFWVDLVLPPLPPGPYHGPEGMHPDDIDWIVVVTDARFENEARRIKEYGGQIWKVYDPRKDNQDSHASEAPLPDELVDVTIVNDGTMEELSAKVYRAFMEQFVLPPRKVAELDEEFQEEPFDLPEDIFRPMPTVVDPDKVDKGCGCG